MTSRPKDIPQDVWDAAREVVADTQGCDCSHCVGTIARAIMAATERAALIAEKRWRMFDKMLETGNVPEHLNERAVGRALEGQHIASAIRQGSQPPKPSNDDFRRVPHNGEIA